MTGHIKILTTEDVDAFKQKSRYSGSVFDGNQRTVWHLLPLFTVIKDNINHFQADKKIEF